MIRRPYIVALILICIALAAVVLTASVFEPTIEPSAQSLRGEKINLNDQWSVARLLAHFGENRRAYEMLKRGTVKSPLDLQVERFEARIMTEIGLYSKADSLLALQPYIGGYKGLYLHHLWRARLNALMGNYSRALEFLAAIRDNSDTVFDPYRDFLVVEALLRTGRPIEACEVGEGRLADGIPKSLTPHFQERLLEAYVSSGRIDDALAFVEVLKQRRSRWSVLAPVIVREIDLLFAKGDTLRAINTALEYAGETATRALAVDAVESAIMRVTADSLSTEALLEFAEIMMSRGRLGDTERLISQLDARTLTETQTEQRRLVSAELLYREKRYSRAFKLLETDFEDAAYRRRGMLLRARIFRKIGQPGESARAYEEFSTVNPYDRKAPEALFVAADLHLNAGDRQGSNADLRRIMETYPSSRYSRLSAIKLASYYIDRGQEKRGVKLIEDAVERSGRTDEELLYNLADAYAKTGKTEMHAKTLEEIEALNPISFYLNPTIETGIVQPLIASNGMVALQGPDGLLAFLKRIFEARDDAYQRIRLVLLDGDDTAAFERAAVYVERGGRFLEMGFRDWAERELAALEASGKLPARLNLELGVLYDDYAMHWRSVRSFQRVYYSLKKSRREELESAFRLLMYPTPYPSTVFENCARHGIPPHLIYAMIREESRFDVNAVSRAGAMGLMQLMPATSEQAADELGFPEGIHKNLFSPDINLTVGIWYASSLLHRADGNPLMMLAGYNAGFGNARRWFSDGDPIASVQRIDYRETRSYVKRIVRSAHIYHAFYFAPDARMEQTRK